MTFSGWRTVETSFSYFEDDAPSGRVVTVRSEVDGSVIQTTSQHTSLDAWGRQSGLVVNGKTLASFAYDGNGMPTTASFTSGESATRGYDPLTRALLQLSEYTNTWTSDDVFGFNARGLIGQETLSVGQTTATRTYDYSPPGFLTGSTDAKTAYHYAFDAFGLPTSIQQDDKTRAITRTGNTLSVGSSDYQFDSFGRVVQIDDLQLAYGPTGDLATASRGNKQWTYNTMNRVSAS